MFRILQLVPGDGFYKPKQRAFRLAKKHCQLSVILASAVK